MESTNVMAKISHGCGGVGSVRSQRRRIVSEPTDSVVFTCDENSSMKLAGSISPNKILIRNDLQNQGQQPQQHLQQVHNTLISSPESMTVSSDAKNELVGGLRLVDQRIGSHYGLPRQQPHHLIKTLEKKGVTTHATAGSFRKGLLQVARLEETQTSSQQQQNTYNDCDLLFTRPERLRQHHAYKGESNNNSGARNIGSSVNNIGPHVIEEQVHISQNNSAETHECGHCKKTFCSKIQLGRHVKIHSGEKAFLCSQCEQTFHRKDHLKTHEKIHQGVAGNHDKSSFYECEREECGKTYNSYSSYMKHRKTHEVADSSLATGGTKSTILFTAVPHQRTLSVGSGMQLKEKLEIASTASSAGPTAATNTPSRRSHREQGEKRFQCMQCSKKFPTSKDLKRHDVVHTGNREFQCSFCSHRFGRKDHRMRHEKKTHALELSNQQQSLSSVGATTVNNTTSTTTAGCSNQKTIQNTPTSNISSNSMHSAPPIAGQAACSSPSSSSSSVSPPALLPIVSSSSPPSNATFALQTNSCMSPNSLSHSSPSHQFPLHDQFQPNVNILALSPPPPPNTTSPCQMLETPNPTATIRHFNEPSLQTIEMIEVKHMQHANKRWRHMSSPSTLQQVHHPSSSNIHVLNSNIIPRSLRTNPGLFSNIIVVENNPNNGMTCTSANNENKFLIRKTNPSENPLDINILLGQPPIEPNSADSMMLSPKLEPSENDSFFEICDNNVSENTVLQGVRALTEQQEQQKPGEMILSQIKEEKDEKYGQHNQNFVIGNEINVGNQQMQQMVTRVEASETNCENALIQAPSSPLHHGEQPLIKTEFLLKNEGLEEPMEEIDGGIETMEDHPNALSNQLQETSIKPEEDGNGDIDWLLTEMMTDSQMVTATTSNIVIPQPVAISSSFSSYNKPSPGIQPSLKSTQVGEMSNYLSSSVPVGNTAGFGGPRLTHVKTPMTTQPEQHIVVSQYSQPKIGSLDNTTLLYEDQNSSAGLGLTVLGQRPNYSVNTQNKKLLGDLFTGTKNPVLPSIYTDSTLIVPEPRASKYHSPHQSLQMFESDFMDIDSFLKGGSSDLAINTGDGKDAPESMFNI